MYNICEQKNSQTPNPFSPPSMLIEEHEEAILAETLPRRCIACQVNDSQNN